ncbi:MAG: ABC transporter permease [Ekhidna sp.]
MSKRPPKYLLRFFRWFCHPDCVEDIEGDLRERFDRMPSRWRFAFEVIKLLRPSLIKPVSVGKKLNYYGMITHHIKSGWRSILKHKSFSSINIIGLSTGVAVCLVTLIFYRYETSFDDYHQYADQTYRVVQHTQRGDEELYWNTTAYPLAEALRNDFPDFAEVTQTAGPMKRLFKLEGGGDEKVVRFEEEHVLFVDHTYPEVFDFEWLAGDKTTALKAPNAVVISAQIAKKCFGDNSNPSSAIGHTLLLNNNDPLVITGVIKNPPRNTTLKGNMLVSYQFFKKHNPYPTGNWSGNYRGTTFVVLDPSLDQQGTTAKINGWKQKYLSSEDDEIISYKLQPLKEIHTETKYGVAPGAYQISKAMLNTSLVVAVFILFIAVVNFVNLVTARASTRSKEVGIRKAIGGSKTALLSQFLVENSLLVIISMGLALVLSVILLDEVNVLLAGIGMNLFFQWEDMLIGLGLCFVIILLSALYPSYVLSSYKPVHISSIGIKGSMKGLGFRKSLTFTQFTLVQIFIISALIVGSQLHYLNSKTLGFDSDQIVMIPVPSGDKVELLSSLLKDKSDVRGASIGSGPPMAVEDFTLGTTYRHPHQEQNDGMSAEMKIADPSYLSLYSLELIAGRNFRENKARFDEFIINRKMAKSLGWSPEEALGKKVAINEGEATVVGVMEDFHNHSLKNELTPLVLMNWEAWRWQASVKISSFEGLIAVEETWESVFPDQIFSYRFLDDSIAKEYVIEQMIFKGFRFLSVLVILIGCLGLLGLVSFITLQKTKEIGVRKVLGASVGQIIRMFTRNFAMIIVAGFVIAIPIVYYFMSQWLNSFNYRISISIWMFIGGGLITLTLGITVSILRSLKAARVNPVDSLRNE